MQAKLENIFIDVCDLNYTGDPKKGPPQAMRLTQSRLGIFFTDAATGRPLGGWPIFVNLELDIRYAQTPSTGPEYDELTPRVFSFRVPLGLLATDHIGYASYDLTLLPQLIPIAVAGQTDALPLTVTSAEASQQLSILGSGVVQLAIKSIWIQPYGTFAFDGLTPGLFGLRPDAVVVNALLEDIPIRSETMSAGIPAMQEPSIVDWRLSPGSFAISPALAIGQDECARFTPTNVALDTYYFNRVVLQTPPTPPIIVQAAGSPPITQPPSAVVLSPPAQRPADPAGSPLAAGPAARGAVGPAQQPGILNRLGQVAEPQSSVNRIVQPQAQVEIGPGSTSDFTFPATSGPEVLQATVFVYRTSWFQLGHSLGKVLYSLALAPGENANIAVIDWSREDTTTRQETTQLTEALIADLRRDRLIGETITGVLNEQQSGGSTIAGGSLVAGAGMTSGAMGAMLGLGFSLGGGSAWTSGHRDLQDSDVQTLTDRIRQSSSAVRELRSTVVVASHQQEQNAITTRNITNYNHSHTLTVLYYELLRHLRVVTAFDREFDATLVRFPQLQGVDRSKPESLVPYLSFLETHLLDPSFQDAIAAYQAFEIELNRPDPQSLPTVDQITAVRGLIGNIAIASWKDNDPNHTAILLRVDGTSGPVPVSTQSQIVVEEGNFASFLLTGATAFILPIFYGDDTDKEFKERKHISFSVDFASPQLWESLVEMKFQCVFKDDSKDNQFQLQFEEIIGVTDHGTHDLNSAPNHITYVQGNNTNKVKQIGDSTVNPSNCASAQYAIPLSMPSEGGSSRPPFQRLTPDQQTSIYGLLNHVIDNLSYYSLLYWAGNDQKRINYLISLGSNFDASFWPITIFGEYLVFPKLTAIVSSVGNGVLGECLVTLPTRGVFADAKLGECNVSEVIDNTRFWDWQTSPIPFQAPQITGVTPTSAYQPPQAIQPTALPAPIVSMQTAPAAPDPAVAASLQALTTPNIFRDMSIASQVASVISDVTKAATQAALAAGSLAGNLAKSASNSSGGAGAPTAGTGQTGGTGGNQGGSTQSSQSMGPTGGSSGAVSQPVSQGSASATPVPTSNARQLWVKIDLGATDYVAASLNMGGHLEGAGTAPFSVDNFWVTYAANTPEVASIDIYANIQLYTEPVGTLMGHYSTTTAQPLSALKGLTCIPRITEVAVEALQDITSSSQIQDQSNWKWNVTAGGKIDFPSVAGKLQELEIKGVQQGGQVGGEYGQSGSTTTTTASGTLFRKGWKATLRLIDFSEPAEFQAVNPSY